MQLGDVLYSGRSEALVPESEWAGLVDRVATGDQGSLHALYERSHRAVYTLAVRITGNPATAEELTLDVFHDVWRRAKDYDPANGTVLGWIMNQARSRAIDRVRFEQRKKRADGQGPPAEEGETPIDGPAILEGKQRAAALRSALSQLSVEERDAIQSAYFSDLSHAEVATRLGVPLGTIKTRIRSGLAKLRRVLDHGAETA